MSCVAARHPGKVREILERVLGVWRGKAARRTAEEVVTAKSRGTAAWRRKFRNRVAAGTVPEKLPWARGRTLLEIKREEQVLAIALKFSRMGEYRK